MNILFFDTETNGLPKSWESPPGDISNWPRIVQLAWILSDASGGILDKGECIIKPTGWTIPPEASRVHGITTEKASTVGVDVVDVLKSFDSLVDRADIICAHNLKFDLPVIWAEFQRSRVPSLVYWKTGICTMLSTVEYCALSGKGATLKWPKLQELHVKLFGEEFTGAHDALSDIEATHRCFFELLKIQEASQWDRFFDMKPKTPPIFLPGNKIK